MLLVFAVALVAWSASPEESETGLVFTIPAGASNSIGIPTIDSAIDVPTTVTFTPGEVAAITIYNEDTIANRAGPWVIGPGQSYTARFDEPGTYQFDCVIDPTESVTVVVEES